MGQVIDPMQLPVLTARLLLPADSEERETLQQGFARFAATRSTTMLVRGSFRQSCHSSIAT